MTARAATKVATQPDFVLGDRTFAAISAVEGLKLSPESRKRLAQTRALAPSERRAASIRAFASARKSG